METISHRELRNNSADILRRVAAGESFLVTNHGETVGQLIPAATDVLDQLRAAGQVVPARRARSFEDIEPVKVDISTQELLDDIRGEW